MEIKDMDSPLSPCIGVCRIDSAGLCTGCRRSLDEIGSWSSMTHAQRLVVIEQLAGRPHAEADDH